MRDIRAGTANHAGWFRLHEKLKISLITNKELKGKSSTIVLTKSLRGGEKKNYTETSMQKKLVPTDIAIITCRKYYTRKDPSYHFANGDSLYP